MKRNFGYRGHNPEIGDPANVVKGIIEIEEASIWRRSDGYPAALGVKEAFLTMGSLANFSPRHNPIANGAITFIQNEEYYLHIVENFSSSSGTTTRYWSIDSTAHDLMFQDLTGTITVTNSTGSGSAVFRTRFIEWFTTAPTFYLRIRSGSTSGPILQTFTMQPLLPYISTQFYDNSNSIDANLGGLTEGQKDNSYNDWRLIIGNVGYNASAGFSGLVKTKIASTTLNTASADDIEFTPAAPYDVTANSYSAVAQMGSGETTQNIVDYNGFNVRSDATTEGTETFTVGLEAYKDPVVGGTTTIGNIVLSILDTSVPFTFTFDYAPAARSSYDSNNPSLGPRSYYPTGGSYSNIGNLFYNLGGLNEDKTTRFLPKTTTTGVGGRYYYEVVQATGTVTDQYGQVLGTIGGTNADWTPNSGHFSIDDTGAFDVAGGNIDITAVLDTQGAVAEEYEGFKVNVYPEDKNPATLLGTSSQVIIVNVTANNFYSKMKHFASGSYLSTSSTNGGNLTNGYDIKDFVIPSDINGLTGRIYIGGKCNGSTVNAHDYAIAGIQIINSSGTVTKAMAIRGLNNEQTWVTPTNPLTYLTSAGYFQTTSFFDNPIGNAKFEDLSTVVGMTYYNLNSASIYNMSSGNNFVNGRWNVTGFNNFGTPTTYTGMAGGVNPGTHSNTGSFVALNAENSSTIEVQPTTQASYSTGHIYMESDGMSGTQPGAVLRSPTHTFSTGETIRVCFQIATNSGSFSAYNALFLGVA